MRASCWLYFALGVIACAGRPRQAPATVVAIDPGHPSETSSGAEIQNGTSEVHVAWAVALQLGQELRARGFTVVMTKSAEREVVLNRERADIGNRARAALMVRLHCDASSDSGYAVYHPDREGTVDGKTGPRAVVIAKSAVAADSVHAGLKAGIGARLKDGGVRGDSRTLVGSRQGALTGSIYSEIPVVLVEMVTLSNPRDADFIRGAAGQALMARSLADGIARYLAARRLEP